MSADNDCRLCSLADDPVDVNGRIYEDATWIVGVDPTLPIPGAVVIRTKRHNEGVHDLDAAEARTFGVVQTRISSAVLAVSEAPRVYSVAFGEVCPHFHVLVLPRPMDPKTDERGAGYVNWRLQRRTLAELDEAHEVAAAMKEHLARVPGSA